MDNQALLWSKNKDLNFADIFYVQGGVLYEVPKKYIQDMVHHTINPCKIWHKKLGHLHYKILLVLQRMVKGMLIFDFEHDSVYRGFALGKNVKNIFSSNNCHKPQKSIYNFFLIHTYISIYTSMKFLLATKIHLP